MVVPAGSDGAGWTPSILKQYVDQRFLDSDKAVSAALQAAKEAVAKAEVATDKRFDAIREDADRRAHDLWEQIAALQTNMHHEEGSTETVQRLWSLLLPAFLSLVIISMSIYLTFHK